MENENVKQTNTIHSLQKLMNSYVPEFSYEEKGKDPGSVMTDLCGRMIEDSEKQYEKVLHKHKIQFLNLFDAMKTEPISAAKGYVKFNPVSGYEGDVMVPAGTQVMSSNAQPRDIIFETIHDMAATIAVPEVIINTDRSQDRIVKIPYTGEGQVITSFDVSGENQSQHRMYLCFDELFMHLDQLDFRLYIEMRNSEEQQSTMEYLAGDGVCFKIIEEDGTEVPFDQITAETDGLHFIKEDYQPQKSIQGANEGYYVVLEAKDPFPELYINKLEIGFGREDIVPEEVLVNGISEAPGAIMPFGKPLELYSEAVIEHKEVFTKKGAEITIDFELDYIAHKDVIEMPELQEEYKVIMKRPKKMAEMPVVQVKADYVIWEYLSHTGWKRIWKEEHIAAMFDGQQTGLQKLTFVCPDDMETETGEESGGKIRVRLLRAENIYKVPALYLCPRITGLKLSYSYEHQRRSPDYAYVRNCFDERDITRELIEGGGMKIFHNQEHERRSMYIGFDAPIWGSPISIYFDLENYSDLPIDFAVEYLSDHGFVTLKVEDHTDGFLGSGNMLMLIPKDMVKKQLYGYEGYFLRFVNYNKEHKEYALPKIKSIHMNMAKVLNVNTVTQEFYLDDLEHDQDIQLSQGNLLKLEVWANEKTEEGTNWKLWKPDSKSRNRGYKTNAPGNFRVDMKQGILYLNKYALMNQEFAESGPKFRVKHYNYTGAQANLGAAELDTIRTSVRYVSSVENPFPMYGGYDGYTEHSAAKMISGMLYTRNRAVTERDFYYLIAQTSFGVRKVKCVSSEETFTVAVLIEEYEKGIQIFSEMKESIRARLMENSSMIPDGKELVLIQPHFVKLNVRLWLERESMEQAYEIQSETAAAIRDFIDPLNGGISSSGWGIGQFPQISQIAAYIKTRLPESNISRIVMTAIENGIEIPVNENFYETRHNPFIMAVNGEHIVYIDLV